MKTIFTMVLFCLTFLSYSQKNILLGLEYGQSFSQKSKMNYSYNTECIQYETPVDVLSSNSIRLYLDAIFGIDSTKRHSLIKTIGIGVAKKKRIYRVQHYYDNNCVDYGIAPLTPLNDFLYHTNSLEFDISSSLGVSTNLKNIKLNNSLGANIGCTTWIVSHIDDNSSNLFLMNYFKPILNTAIYYSFGVNWGGNRHNKYAFNISLPIYNTNKTFLFFETYKVFAYQPKLSIQIKL